jgi:hypothetical protein
MRHLGFSETLLFLINKVKNKEKQSKTKKNKEKQRSKATIETTHPTHRDTLVFTLK